MDPNKLLEEVRGLLEDLSRDTHKGLLEHEGVSELLEGLSGLDAWLSAGGAIPKAWRGSIEKILADIARVFRACASVQDVEGRPADAQQYRTKAAALDFALSVIDGREPMPKFSL